MKRGLRGTRSIAALLLACGVCVATVGDTFVTSALGATATKVPARVVRVEMLAISFRPKVIRVKAHETVRFRFENNDVAPHDAYFANLDRQLAREKLAVSANASGNSETSLVTKGYVFVGPKSAAEISYTFGQPGRQMIGCHQPGHWGSGMRLTVIVEP